MQTNLKAFDMQICKVYSVECVPYQVCSLNYILCNIRGGVSLPIYLFDDFENICISRYYHHQFGNMIH